MYPDQFPHGSDKAYGYMYTERYLHDQVKAVRVARAEEANLFYLPALTGGWGNNNSGGDLAKLNAYFGRVYAEYPYWRNSSSRGRVNHFWAVAHDIGALRARDSKFYRDRSILLVNSASTCRGLHSCRDLEMYHGTPDFFDVGKDVSTVSFPTVFAGLGKYPPQQNPRPARDITVYFVGGYRQRSGVLSLLDKDVRIRRDPSWSIVHYDTKSDAAAKRNAKRYWTSLQRSKYALHIHGHQPFSSRLFEAMAAGAVPIIIAPGYVLPFEDLLDWGQFSLRVEPRQAGHLYDIVSGLPDAVYERLARNTAHVAHHFKYNKPRSQPGDAFHMTMYDTLLKSQQVVLPYVSSGAEPERGLGES